MLVTKINTIKCKFWTDCRSYISTRATIHVWCCGTVRQRHYKSINYTVFNSPRSSLVVREKKTNLHTPQLESSKPVIKKHECVIKGERFVDMFMFTHELLTPQGIQLQHCKKAFCCYGRTTKNMLILFQNRQMSAFLLMSKRAYSNIYCFKKSSESSCCWLRKQEQVWIRLQRHFWESRHLRSQWIEIS